MGRSRWLRLCFLSPRFVSRLVQGPSSASIETEELEKERTVVAKGKTDDKKPKVKKTRSGRDNVTEILNLAKRGARKLIDNDQQVGGQKSRKQLKDSKANDER